MTAIQYLFIELYQFINVKHYQEVNDVFDKAKEMEQNQIIRAVNHSIMKLDEMRAEAIKQNITIGELYIKMNKDEKVL